MPSLDKFYKKLIEDAKNLIGEKKYEDAYVLIKDEMTSSYIPLEFVDEIEKIYSIIMKEINLEHYARRFETMSKQQLLNSMLRNGKVDFDGVIYLLTKFGGSLGKEDFEYFNEIFNSGLVINSNKIAVLNELFLSGIQTQFKFYNVNTKKHFNVTPVEDIRPRKGYYGKVKEGIKKMLFKEPNLLNLALEIVDSFYWYYFDASLEKSAPDMTEQELTDIICEYIRYAFGQKASDANIEFVSNVLEEKKLLN